MHALAFSVSTTDRFRGGFCMVDSFVRLLHRLGGVRMSEAAAQCLPLHLAPSVAEAPFNAREWFALCVCASIARCTPLLRAVGLTASDIAYGVIRSLRLPCVLLSTKQVATTHPSISTTHVHPTDLPTASPAPYHTTPPLRAIPFHRSASCHTPPPCPMIPPGRISDTPLGALSARPLHSLSTPFPLPFHSSFTDSPLPLQSLYTYPPLFLLPLYSLSTLFTYISFTLRSNPHRTLTRRPFPRRCPSKSKSKSSPFALTSRPHLSALRPPAR